MQLERPSSREEAVAALSDGGRVLAGGTELVPLLKEGLVTAERLVDVTRRAAARDLGRNDRCRRDARGARGRSADPGGAARGVPARRLASAPQHGHDRRQPPAGHTLLVLAPRLPLLPARRRPLPREGGPAPRARVLRQRALRLGASVRPGCGPARARRDDPNRPARAADRRSVPAADRGRPLDDDPRSRAS